MKLKWMLCGMVCALSLAAAYAAGPRGGGGAAGGRNPDLDYPARAVEAAKAANLPDPVLLWPNGAPNAKGDSDEDKPAIYVYLPPKEKATGCGVIVTPGGAFTHRAMDQEGVDFAKFFVERGIAAFVLRYRIQPLYGRADYVADGHRSMQFVKAHAAEYGVSVDRIGMIGYSAGSELLCMLAYNPQPGKPDATDVVERQSSKMAFMILAYGSSPVPQGANPRDIPPTFMFCTVEDRSHATGMLSVYRTFYDAQIPAEIHLFPNGEHGTGLAQGDRQIGE